MFHYICYVCGENFESPLQIQCPCPEFERCKHELCVRHWIDVQPPGDPFLDDYMPEDTYKYFITFTKKPEASIEQVTEAFLRFTKSTTPRFIRIHYTTEHIESNAHIHAFVISHKPIRPSFINRYAKYGKIDKQKAKGTELEILDYMSKESDLKSIQYK